MRGVSTTCSREKGTHYWRLGGRGKPQPRRRRQQPWRERGAWRWRTEEGEERGGDRGEFHCDIEHLVTRFPWWRDGSNGASLETAKTVAAAPVMVMIPTMTQHLEVVCEVTRKKGRWL